MHMDTRLLTHFLALIDTGNFARAAEQVHLSQPAFSRSIQQLESQLGVSLFDRGRQGAQPTPFARAALPHVRQTLSALASLRQEMDALQGLTGGELAIGTGPYPALGLVDQACSLFADRYPAVQLQVYQGNWAELAGRLLGGELELFIADTRELEHQKELQVTELPQRPGQPFCRADHPLLKDQPVSWQALLEYPLATTRLPHDIETQLAELAAPYGGLKRRIRCDNVAMLVSIVRQSQAVSLAPDGAILRELESGELIPLPVAGLDRIRTHYGLVQHRGRSLSPAAREFAGLIRERSEARPSAGKRR